MGILWRLLAPKSVKRARRTVRRATHPVRTAGWALSPKPVKQLRRGAFKVAHPGAALELAVEDQIVRSLRGGKRRRPAPKQRPRVPRPSASPLSSSAQPVEVTWLAGTTELRVVGVTFRPQAVEIARRQAPPAGTAAARLVRDPSNLHDPFAVKVMIQDQHVGWLSRHISPVMQPALTVFSAAHEGRLVSCPARFSHGSLGMGITLYLDLAPLGIDPADVDYLPELDQVILNLLARLDEPVPVMTGRDDGARQALSAAEADRAATDEDYDRNPEDWPRAERAFRAAADRLEAARDPLVSDAWLGVAQSTRYQRGRGEDMLTAAVEALYWDVANAGAWHELIARAATAPHVPTLITLFARVPRAVRPPVLRQLLTISRGQDRLGNMTETAGQQLRAELLALARSQGDEVTAKKLARLVT
jgi:hypothetical protein